MSEVKAEAAPGKVHWHKKGHVGYIIFDNQKKFNAVNFDMWLAIPKAVAEFNADPDIRVVVLEGAGEKAFVSGADISQFGDKRSGDGAAEYNKATEAGYMSILACTKPVVAKIRGICMGGGLGIIMNCDVRICADNAKFRMPAGRLGLGYAFGGLKRFSEVIGPANTADLFFSARIFGGADARAIVDGGAEISKQTATAQDLELFKAGKGHAHHPGFDEGNKAAEAAGGAHGGAGCATGRCRPDNGVGRRLLGPALWP